MNNTSPSAFRRRGRIAYENGYRQDEPPWERNSYIYQHYYQYWLEGWHQAEKEYEQSLKDQQEKDDEEYQEYLHIKYLLDKYGD